MCRGRALFYTSTENKIAILFLNEYQELSEMTLSHFNSVGKLFIVGASRGLGYAVAEEFLKEGWEVVGTVFESGPTMLHDLAESYAGQLRIEMLDIREPEQIAALRRRLSSEKFDVLFVNAGVTNDPGETAKNVSTSEFIRVMLTNALGPMRVIEAFEDLVTPAGTIGVMSSGQGSVTNNETGGLEVYRSSKAALNMFMRSYAARHVGEARSLLVLAPGWVRTEMGGSDATLSIAESIPKLVRVMLAERGVAGLKYLDYQGKMVPW
jgi:NAD(P)-dependent dehydrogenase (short-subunit alcohol dehydrogenase family)